jgi:pyridinium-3,5-biscarboxylic acid mononucleotide synthase
MGTRSMLPQNLREALRKFKTGEITEEEMEGLLRDLPFQDLGFARVDHHRALRHGFPEVIFGQNKSAEQVLSIARSLLARQSNLLVTRCESAAYKALRHEFPEIRYYEASRAAALIREKQMLGQGTIGVYSAGTADIPVAEEAVVTAETMGNEVAAAFDVGVAGLHRILHERDALQECSVVVVVAGMEGALPSVVGGLVGVPVIAVPTSVGYGASFGGLAALLGMLNSCASNVAVVNIDNGFGAGYIAALINRRGNPEPR